MDIQEKDNKVRVNLEFERPTTGRLFSTRLFDIFITLVVAFFLFFAGREVMHKMSFYKEALNRREEVLISSRLYVKEENQLHLLSDYLDDNENLTDHEKNERYEEDLTYFYTSFLKDTYQEGSSHYLELKGKALSNDGQDLFTEEGNRALTNSAYENDYLSFYKNLVENDALGYLQTDNEYLTTRNALLKDEVTNLIVMILMAFFLTYFVFPLIFYKSKATLGMKLNHLGTVNGDGLMIPFWKWLLRFLFIYIIEVIGSFAALLIPLIVDVTFIFKNKAHQGLADYVFGTYTVIVKDRTIYKNKAEIAGEILKEQEADKEVDELTVTRG